MSEYPRPSHWRCRVERSRDTTWLSLGGELDVAVAPALDAALRAAQADGSRVIVDLGELEFMDSSGLHVLIEADARAHRANAQLLIVRPPASVQRLFELTGTLERLSILDTSADALAAGCVGVVNVDDHAVFLEAMRAVIAATQGFELLGEATNGEDAIRLVADMRPDLVLLDVGLPDISGFETSSRLALLRPRPVVILVSAGEGPSYSEGAAGHGALAFLPKRCLRPSTLRAAWGLRGVHGAEIALGREAPTSPRSVR